LFFFQAEDGIRDDLVTGVQTCALPISMSLYTPPTPTNAYPTSITAGGLTTTFGYYFGSGRRAFSIDPNNVTTSRYYSDPFDRPRSEERRVGKEVKSRWMNSHLKK